MKPWLTIIGIGEDGMAGLSAAARRLVEDAEIIVGGDRHHDLAPNLKAERISWPSPFDDLIGLLESNKGRPIVVLATGDPLWYSVGARIARRLPPGEITFLPQVSAFQWAACRMGWSMADLETLTAHGRAAEQVIPYFWPGARLLILTAGSETPGEVARLLDARGYGASRMTVLANLGSPEEHRIDATAAAWAATDPTDETPPFHTLAVTCEGTPQPLLSRLPGLPDEAFANDGVMTKREVRAITLAGLMPARGEMLWDIGTGCGSVAVEWMRAGGRAIGIENNPDRMAMAARNATLLGAPELELVGGEAPAALGGLKAPDAVFIGGGIATDGLFEACWSALKPGGRLVANTVTIEGESALARLQREFGGEMVRLAVSRLSPVGKLHGWKPMMQVTQWQATK